MVEMTQNHLSLYPESLSERSNLGQGLDMSKLDDIVIYSSDSGTEVVAFEDNFQGRVAGDNLNPDINLDSPYHVNSADATVGEDE